MDSAVLADYVQYCAVIGIEAYLAKIDADDAPEDVIVVAEREPALPELLVPADPAQEFVKWRHWPERRCAHCRARSMVIRIASVIEIDRHSI